MRIVRERTEARWLPSRFRYATFKLYAYAHLRAARPNKVPGVVLVINRDQNPIETSLLSAGICIMTYCFLFSVFSAVMNDVPAATVALIATPVVIEVVVLGIGVLALLLTPKAPGGVVFRTSDLNSFVILVLLTIAASYLALDPAWVRHVGRVFLLGLVINALAAPIAWMLRGRFAQLDVIYGVES